MASACDACGCAFHECECLDDAIRLASFTFDQWRERYVARETFILWLHHVAYDLPTEEVLAAIYDDRVVALLEGTQTERT